VLSLLLIEFKVINMDGTDFKDFKKQLLNNQGVLAEYDALERKYEIIQTIIARRNELAISQRELARMLGMQQPAICRLERGDNNITIGTLFRVAKALELEIQFKPKEMIKT
jgi:DNA-binding XRE family transcriptional regulator